MTVLQKEKRAAVLIQRIARGRNARRALANEKEQARKIQSVFRGLRTRSGPSSAYDSVEDSDDDTDDQQRDDEAKGAAGVPVAPVLPSSLQRGTIPPLPSARVAARGGGTGTEARVAEAKAATSSSISSSIAGCLPLEAFPIPKEFVLDPSLRWNVGGKARTLPADDAGFEKVFRSVTDIPSSTFPLTRAKFASFRGWKQKRLLKCLAAPKPFSYKFPHSDVRPYDFGSLVSSSDGSRDTSINWSTCCGVERSSAGSEGVLFVELANKEAVCVKAPAKIAAEVFGTRLAEMVGIECPRLYVVDAESEEGKEIKRALLGFDQQRAPEQRQVAKILCSRRFFLVIEYVPGFELADQFRPTSDQWASETFGVIPAAAAEAAAQTSCEASLSPKGLGVLRKLGQLVALDMVLNNYDRLPTIWNNKGNPGNVMFTKDTNEPISIDNMCFSIDPSNKDTIKVFEDRVRFACLEVARSATVQQADFRRIREFLRDGCVEGHGWPGLGIEVGTEGVAAVQMGFMETARRFAFGSADSDEKGDGAEEGKGEGGKNAAGEKAKAEGGGQPAVTAERLNCLIQELFIILQGIMPLGEPEKGKGVGDLHGFESIHPESASIATEATLSLLSYVPALTRPHFRNLAGVIGVINIFKESIEQASRERRQLEALGFAAAATPPSTPGGKGKKKKGSVLVGMRVRSQSQTQSAKKRRKPPPARLRTAAKSVIIVGSDIFRITSSQSRKKEILRNLRAASVDVLQNGDGGGAGCSGSLAQGGNISSKDLLHKLNARTMRSKHKKWKSTRAKKVPAKPPKPSHPRKDSVQKRKKRDGTKGIDLVSWDGGTFAAATSNAAATEESETGDKGVLDGLRGGDNADDENAEVASGEATGTDVYPLSRLLDTAKDNWPANIDPAKRESYLSSTEFVKVFGMQKTEWDELPKWKRVRAKKGAGLF